MTNSLDSYLILSSLLFCIGTFGFLARRNAISMLMSIELMLNAVNLSIVAFGAFNPALRPQAPIQMLADASASGGLEGPVAGKTIGEASTGCRPFSDIQFPELLAAKQSLARAARGHRLGS